LAQVAIPCQLTDVSYRQKVPFFDVMRTPQTGWDFSGWRLCCLAFACLAEQPAEKAEVPSFWTRVLREESVL